MFDSLSEKLTVLFKDLTGKGKLSEDNIKEASVKSRQYFQKLYKATKKSINKG